MVSRGRKKTHTLVVRVGHEVPGVVVWRSLLYCEILGDISYYKERYRMVFASMRAVHLFLRARAVIRFSHASSEPFRNYKKRAASTS